MYTEPCLVFTKENVMRRIGLLPAYFHLRGSTKSEKIFKRLIFALSIVGILVLTGAPAAAITGGLPDGDAHPNVGIMGVFFGGVPVGACTATLVGGDVVLTAAHCIANALSFGDGVTVMVSFDEDPVTNPGAADWKIVNQLIMHPDFYWGPQSNPHDIGLLILANEVTDITPATLAGEGFLDDLKSAHELAQGSDKTQFTVVGFGATLVWPPPVINLVPHPRRNAQSEYRSLLKAWLRLSQNLATDNGGSCFGDSGGPVFWTDGAGNETIVGITSWGDPRCISPSFDYRVDIAESLGFISPYLSGVGF